MSTKIIEDKNNMSTKVSQGKWRSLYDECIHGSCWEWTRCAGRRRQVYGNPQYNHSTV